MGTPTPSSLGALTLFLWVGTLSQVISGVLISYLRGQVAELPLFS